MPRDKIGRWRLIQMDQWDGDFIDLVEPRFISFTKRGQGRLRFGAVSLNQRSERAGFVISVSWFAAFTKSSASTVLAFVRQTNGIAPTCRRRSARMPPEIPSCGNGPSAQHRPAPPTPNSRPLRSTTLEPFQNAPKP